MKIELRELTGVITPIVSPLKEDESIDEDLVDSLVRYQLRSGINGLFLLGSCGEFTALSLKEREKLISRTVGLVDKKVPILVGITHCSTREALKMAAQASQLGADALVIAPPYYYPLANEALKEHLLAIADRSSIPLFIYNIPQTTKIHLDIELVIELSKHPMIAGIKDSSGNFSFFQQLICYAQSPNFRVFQGHEEFIAGSLLIGADGIVPGLSNILPELYLQFIAKARELDVQACLELQRKVYSLLEIYNYGSVYGALKAGLCVLNVWSNGSATSMPLQQPNMQQVERIRDKLPSFRLL